MRMLPPCQVQARSGISGSRRLRRDFPDRNPFRPTVVVNGEIARAGKVLSAESAPPHSRPAPIPSPIKTAAAASAGTENQPCDRPLVASGRTSKNQASESATGKPSKPAQRTMSTAPSESPIRGNAMSANSSAAKAPALLARPPARTHFAQGRHSTRTECRSPVPM